MPDDRRSDDTSELVEAARKVDEIGTRICNTMGEETPHLIARIEALRKSLRTMVDHANLALEASQQVREADDMQHRDHIRQIESADYIMNREAEGNSARSPKETAKPEPRRRSPAA